MPIKRLPLSKTLSCNLPASPVEEGSNSATIPLLQPSHTAFPPLQQSPTPIQHHQSYADDSCLRTNASVDTDLGCISPEAPASPPPPPPPSTTSPSMIQSQASSASTDAYKQTNSHLNQKTHAAAISDNKLVQSSTSLVSSTVPLPSSSSSSKRFSSRPNVHMDVFTASKPVTCRSLNDIAESFERDILAETNSQHQEVSHTSVFHPPSSASYTAYQQRPVIPQSMYQSMNSTQHCTHPQMAPAASQFKSTPSAIGSDSRCLPHSIAGQSTFRPAASSQSPKAYNHFAGNSIQINQYGTAAPSAAAAFPFTRDDIAMIMPLPQQPPQAQRDLSMMHLPPTYPIHQQPRTIQPTAALMYGSQQQLVCTPHTSLPFHAPIPAAKPSALSYDNMPSSESSARFRNPPNYVPAADIHPHWLHSPAIVSHPAARTWINQQSQLQYQNQQQQHMHGQGSGPAEQFHHGNKQPAMPTAVQPDSIRTASGTWAPLSPTESTPCAGPFRPDAKLGKSGNLDAYFGVPQKGTLINKMNTPRKRKSVLEQPTSSSASVAAVSVEKKKKKRKIHSQKQKRQHLEQTPVEINDDTDEPTFEYEEDATSEEDRMIETAANPSSSLILKSSSSSSIANAAEWSKFNQLFSSQGYGYCGRAVNYMKLKHLAQDLSDPSSTALADFRSCVNNSAKWTMCILNQDLSTNFRIQTKEQKKFLKNMVGESKKTEEDLPKVWNGGIKPPTVLVVEFLVRKPVQNPNDAQSSITPLSDEVKDEFSVHAINPYPYSSNSVSQYERSGLFILPMFIPISMAVTSDKKSSIDVHQIQHNWNVRREFMSLLQNPPDHTHCVLFNAKALICAVLIHFHVSSLDVDLIPQLNDTLMAAWLCDPDDYRNTEFNIDALIQAYCPMHRSQQGRTLLTAGDKDLDVMMEDMRDSLMLYDRLVERMDKEQLIPACVRQEMPLLSVVIDMQVRGVAVNTALFQQAEEKLKAKIDDMSILVHEAAGHSISLSSAAQVAKVLYEEFDVTPPKLVDKGRSQAKEKTHHTTNDYALRSIISDTKVVVGARKIAEAVLRFRAWYKILTGYLIPWGKSTVSDSNLVLELSSSQLRICPIWNQFATGTGRLSCCNPNLQATPKSAVKRGLTLEGDESSRQHDDQNDAEEDNMENGMNASSHLDSPMIGESMAEAQEARPVNLPIDINMRSVLVPTPATVVQRISRDRMAVLDQQLNQLVFPAHAIDQAQQASILSDRILLSADYSQMEVRLLAQLSKDTNLITVFDPSYQGMNRDAHSSSSAASIQAAQSSGDVYRRMASIMFIKDFDQVSDAERNISKTIVLGVMYGMGADSLAGKLTKFSNKTVTQKDAQSYISKLYEQFPMVKSFMNNTRADGALFGYVPTLIGRRRYLPDLKLTCGEKKAYAERQAVNTVIQGSAADMTKMAMIGIRTRLRQDPLLRSSVWLIMQLHDEIVLELPLSMMHTVASMVREVMENVMPTASVPFTTNIKIGREGLGELEPYGVYCQHDVTLR